MDFVDDEFRISLIGHVETIVGRLSQPLWYYDEQRGWDEKGRIFWLGFFDGLLSDLRQPQFPHKKYKNYHMVIGMDSWGIREGSLYHLAVKIGNYLHTFVESMQECDD